MTWRDYAKDHPACRNGPDWTPSEPFNEDWAREDFGHEFIDQLKDRQQKFCGDWWLLAMLLRCAEAAAEADPDGNDKDRLRRWNDEYGALHAWGATAHLQQADLKEICLQYVNLSRAHLEHTDFTYSRLDSAYLREARLEHSDFSDACIRDAVIERACLEHADLRNACLAHALLRNARLQHAVLKNARLEHAALNSADLEYADLGFADLEHADLNSANLKRANLKYARIGYARLLHAHLDFAWLDGARLDHADVRWAKGILFDQNPVDRLNIEGLAPDPWSRLRREYTGPRFFFHLLLLVAFLLPYAARILHLSVLGELHDAAARAVERADAYPDEAPLAGSVRDLIDRFETKYEETPAAWVLVGGTKGWLFLPLTLVVAGYNALRLLLTVQVSALRDAEERSRVTPSLREYYGNYPPLLGRDLLLPGGIRDRQPFRGGDLARAWVGWLSAWFRATSWRRATAPLFMVLGRRTDEPRWRFRLRSLFELAPLRVLGLWRVHQIARVLFWFAAASFFIHAVHWTITTMVWVER